MAKPDLKLVHIQGAVEIYKQNIGSVFFCSYDQYFWRMIGSSYFMGPFDSIPLAMMNYETYVNGTAKIFSDSPNVIKVDFFNRKRAR